jgi:hypothetical protein
MEDGEWLSQEDKNKMESLKKELANLKKEHKSFAAKKGGVTPEEREAWRLNSHRTNQIYIEIKDLRHKNIIEAGKG